MAGSTDNTDVTVGIDTSSAGHKTGSVDLDFSSDGTGIDSNGVTALADQTVQVSGDVYREAAASIAALPSNPIVHVGDTLNEALSITNTAANDGYSENLTASVASATPASRAPAPPATSPHRPRTTPALRLASRRRKPVTVSGSVTLNLASDGTGVDGLGSVDLRSRPWM